MDYSLGQRLYQLTPGQHRAYWRRYIDRLPTCAFSEMQANASYLFQGRHGRRRFAHQDAFRVERLTPSGGQAMVRDYDSGGTLKKERRIYAGTYHGDFHKMDEPLIGCIGVSHEDVVRAAVRRGLPVPARVRCYYPLLFARLPERFSGRAEGSNSLQRVLTGSTRPLSAADVRAMIERSEDRYIQDRRTWAEFVIRSEEEWDSYERIGEAVARDIAFYRWLLPLVQEDGVFHVGDPPEAVAA